MKRSTRLAGWSTGALLGLLMLVGAAGCGGSDKKKSSGSVADAKQNLVNDCHKGHEGDNKDLNQCKCIVDKLAATAKYATAEQLDAVRKEIKDGKTPPALLAAGKACPKQT